MSHFRKPAFIYFVQAGGPDGPVRIGLSSRPADRLADLQKFSPLELKTLAVVPGSFAQERLLHWLFGSQRIRGDWFRPSAEILACAAFAGALGRVPVKAKEGVEVPKLDYAGRTPRRPLTPEQRVEFAETMARYAAHRRSAREMATA